MLKVFDEPHGHSTMNNEYKRMVIEDEGLLENLDEPPCRSTENPITHWMVIEGHIGGTTHETGTFDT